MTVVFFVLLEGVLAVMGVLPANTYEDPYVGFSGAQPLFEGSGPGGGILETAQNKLSFFNYQSFPRKKGENTCRIFCLGGSTTFGRPYDDHASFCGWLREMLPAADPSRRWEVINAGGISYASYRIALLVEELVQYEPDMFIIYTGHNEFLEKRTYGRLLEGPGFMDTVRGILGRTRVYTLAQYLQAHSREEEPKSGNDLLNSEVVTRLEKTVGPEDYTRASLFTDEVIAHFRYNLGRMVTLAEGAGARVIFVTPAANLLDCSPFKSEHRPGMSDSDLADSYKCYERAEKAERGNEWVSAEAAASQALAIDDRYAFGYYLRGRARYYLGQYDEAKVDLEHARDLDVCPLRALSGLVRSVREVAAERGVPCVDFEALTTALAAHHIPGKELFLDHVHPTIEGHRLAAEAILKRLADELAFSIPRDWDSDEMAVIAKRINERLDTKANGMALRNLAQVLSWAGKFEEARDLAMRAAELTPDDSGTHYLIAWSAQQLGDSVQAERHYRKVLELDPDHPMAPLKLAEVLDDMGRKEDAVVLYREAVARRPADPRCLVQLADALAGQREIAEAVTFYEKALEMVPENPDALVGLGDVALGGGRLEKACDYFSNALLQSPGAYDALFGMGEALGRLGDLEQAAQYYLRAIGANSRRTQPHLRLAWIAMNNPEPQKRDPAMALKHAGIAVKLSGGNDADALNTLAMAEAFSGDMAKALETAAEAMHRAQVEGNDQLASAVEKQIGEWQSKR